MRCGRTFHTWNVSVAPCREIDKLVASSGSPLRGAPRAARSHATSAAKVRSLLALATPGAPHTQSDIEALAASIAANGILQNPVIEPERDAKDKPTGYYLVTAGEDLLRAKFPNLF